MGMFDSVFAPCPKCGANVEFQSKSGPCELKQYHYRSVPVEVVPGLRGKEACPQCGEQLTLAVPAATSRISLEVTTDSKEWD